MSVCEARPTQNTGYINGGHMTMSFIYNQGLTQWQLLQKSYLSDKCWKFDRWSKLKTKSICWQYVKLQDKLVIKSYMFRYALFTKIVLK